MCEKITAPQASVTLRRIDRKNIWQIVRLRVNEAQRDFVATNTESILEAYATQTSGGVALPFGIYAGETPVGFLMIGYGDLPGEENPAVARENYTLWRLMIDEKYQGQGYGTAALQAALAYMRTAPCGPGAYCWLSYEPENHAAQCLYTRLGFKENGETDGDEIVSVKKL